MTQGFSASWIVATSDPRRVAVSVLLYRRYGTIHNLWEVSGNGKILTTDGTRLPKAAENRLGAVRFGLLAK